MSEKVDMLLVMKRHHLPLLRSRVNLLLGSLSLGEKYQ